MGASTAAPAGAPDVGRLSCVPRNWYRYGDEETGGMGTFIDESGFLAAGRALQSARMSAGQTLEQVSRALSIRVLYLEALERGEFGRVLGPTYAESMIVRYAMHLGLDAEALLTGAAKPHVGPGDMGARGTEPATSAGTASGTVPEAVPGTAPGTVPGPASAIPAGVRLISV